MKSVKLHLFWNEGSNCEQIVWIPFFKRSCLSISQINHHAYATSCECTELLGSVRPKNESIMSKLNTVLKQKT